MVAFTPIPTRPQAPSGSVASGVLGDTRDRFLVPTTERHRAILRILAENGRVTVAEIAERFEISAATARRDTMFLALTGKAVRNHGGMLPTKAVRGEQHFRARSVIQPGVKAHIASAAADLLPHEGDIFVDAGTTCLEVGRLLVARPKLRIFTNSIPLLAIAPAARATVVGIGGEVRRISLALTGAFTQPWRMDLRFDATVVGASGLDLENGAFTSELHEAAIKAEALRRSTMRLLVADAEKWNRPSAVRFAPWSAFTAFVTNRDLSREARLSLAANNVALHFTGLFSTR